MKKLKLFLYIGLPFLLYSCLNEDYNTLILPKVVYATPIEEVIPIAIRENLEKYMDIFEGETPPEIEGIYQISPFEVVYSSGGGYSPGKICTDGIIEFSNQNGITNVLSYYEEEGEASAFSEEVSVIGNGYDFSAYFIAEGTSSGIYTKTATLVSGTKTTNGIENLYYAFVMLEKGPDMDNKLVDEGTYRIFKDGNYLAENSQWEKSIKFTESDVLCNKSMFNKAKTLK